MFQKILVATGILWMTASASAQPMKIPELLPPPLPPSAVTLDSAAGIEPANKAPLPPLPALPGEEKELPKETFGGPNPPPPPPIPTNAGPDAPPPPAPTPPPDNSNLTPPSDININDLLSDVDGGKVSASKGTATPGPSTATNDGPSIAPPSITTQENKFRTQFLPEIIYGKDYDPALENRHLPTSINMDDLQRMLFQTAETGDVNGLRAVLDKGLLPLNPRNIYSNTPLIHAAVHGSIDILRLLLARGADPNIQNDLGLSALHIAAQTGRPDMVRALLKMGANPSVKDNYGNTPLQFAATGKHFEVSKLLLDGGADREARFFSELVQNKTQMQAVKYGKPPGDLEAMGLVVNKPDERAVPPEIEPEAKVITSTSASEAVSVEKQSLGEIDRAASLSEQNSVPRAARVRGGLSAAPTQPTPPAAETKAAPESQPVALPEPPLAPAVPSRDPQLTTPKSIETPKLPEPPASPIINTPKVPEPTPDSAVKKDGLELVLPEPIKKLPPADVSREKNVLSLPPLPDLLPLSADKKPAPMVNPKPAASETGQNAKSEDDKNASPKAPEPGLLPLDKPNVATPDATQKTNPAPALPIPTDDDLKAVEDIMKQLNSESGTAP